MLLQLKLLCWDAAFLSALVHLHHCVAALLQRGLPMPCWKCLHASVLFQASAAKLDEDGGSSQCQSVGPKMSCLVLQELDKKRHLLRLWVSPEDNRPLPDVYVSYLLLWPDLPSLLPP